MRIQKFLGDPHLLKKSNFIKFKVFLKAITKYSKKPIEPIKPIELYFKITSPTKTEKKPIISCMIEFSI